MICAHCNRPATSPEFHHPDRARHPDLTVPMHAKCHHAHHVAAGDFARWGAMTPTRGRTGYDLALEACPAFHQLGGEARAASARRDDRGRFA